MFALTTLKVTFLVYSGDFIYFVYLNYIIEQQRLIRAAFISVNSQLLKSKIVIVYSIILSFSVY